MFEILLMPFTMAVGIIGYISLIGVVILSLIVSCLVDSKNHIIGGFLSTLLFAYFCYAVDPTFQMISHNPGTVVLIVLSYIGFGLGWAMFRWWYFLKDFTPVDRRNYQLDGVSYFKGRIIAWLMFWPASIVGWMITDLFSNVGNWIYNLFESIFKSIGDYMIGDVKSD